ncbi:MAG: caspase family protein [Syntrophales bacterium]|nr:caspase family protein [Syntrophales bacterium]HOG07687.1 caspase family protein [Syntrophales bacterium]HOS76985.1 caspase family protein [Syntrophales bacterium]HPB71203.1 caspase family protein [Syntrophales bacterium]HQN26198.1 caspase family protein [Syntrophales bacterium]
MPILSLSTETLHILRKPAIYPPHRLYEALNKLPSKRNVVILDSCFSGAGNRSVIAKGLRPLVVMAANQEIVGANTTILSASAGNQVSSTYLEKGHGLMTYFILKGIKEEPIRNQGGHMDMEKLYPYVKQNVERIARKLYNNEQTPQLWIGKQKSGEGK